LGGLAAEIASRGAGVIGIEPGAGWRSLAAERVAAAGHVIGGQGEYLPIASDSIDLVVSHQVLEHVGDPGAVIREAFRVLKPGGYCYVLYANYLSFWEPHYRVRWLPLLPKAVGAMYLRLLGRSPRFLMDSITYTTFPAVRRAFLRAGFECMRERELRLALRSVEKTGWKWRVFRTIAWVSPQAALVLATAADYLRRAFRTAASEWMRKPMVFADPESGRF
jgi:SAM-dependent methyltransferase